MTVPPESDGPATSSGSPEPGNWFAESEGGLWDDGIRYLMVRHDVLAGLFERLEPDLRRTALKAFRQSVYEHGRKSIEAYRENQSGGEETLLRSIEQTAAQLGWGVWSFRDGLEDDLELKVSNSPFARGLRPADDPVCSPIEGMTAAIAEVIHGGRYRSREITCSAVDGGKECRFRVQPDR